MSVTQTWCITLVNLLLERIKQEDGHELMPFWNTECFPEQTSLNSKTLSQKYSTKKRGEEEEKETQSVPQDLAIEPFNCTIIVTRILRAKLHHNKSCSWDQTGLKHEEYRYSQFRIHHFPSLQSTSFHDGWGREGLLYN